jgi:predicted TIM-barrel fold metal-dependent hydrolase
MKLTRRQAIASAAGVLGVGWTLSGYRPRKEVQEPHGPVIDLHAHLFGIGDGGSGCYLSSKQKQRLSYPFFLKLLGLEENGHFDEQYVERIADMLRRSSIDRAVLLAQDCRYDSAGRPDKDNTSVYVPNDYLFQVTRRLPELFIPCVSINPTRRDAIEELERCMENGARILKIHPPIQNVDPGEGSHRPFYRKCAERKVIVMVHTGTEHSAEIVGHDFSAPSRLSAPLEEGCTVVAAHSGMSAFYDAEDFFPQMLELIQRFPHLYCDTAVLADKFRFKCLPRMQEHEDLLERTVYGSDTPFPSNAWAFWNRISPGRLFDLATEQNLFERDFRIKQAVGLPAHVFERGAKLLGLV